ncbi:MAG: hypothetical protein MZV64_36325 [Ignavibacteriales bacterium]|nr:hypothetical protein [Ignavibacteriales bacterium]
MPFGITHEHQRHLARHHAARVPTRSGWHSRGRSWRHRHVGVLLSRSSRQGDLGSGSGSPAADGHEQRPGRREVWDRPLSRRSDAARALDGRAAVQPDLVRERCDRSERRQPDVSAAVSELQPGPGTRGGSDHGGNRQLESGPGVDGALAVHGQQGGHARQAAGEPPVRCGPHGGQPGRRRQLAVPLHDRIHVPALTSTVQAVTPRRSSIACTSPRHECRVWQAIMDHLRDLPVNGTDIMRYSALAFVVLMVVARGASAQSPESAPAPAPGTCRGGAVTSADIAVHVP